MESSKVSPKLTEVPMLLCPKQVRGSLELRGGEVTSQRAAGLAGDSGSQAMMSSAASASPPPAAGRDKELRPRNGVGGAQGVVSLCCSGQLHAAPAHPEPVSSTDNRKAPYGAGE